MDSKMHNFGFMRVAAVTPKVKIGNVEYNVAEILSLAEKINQYGADVAIFPELCLTGYTCGDLFFRIPCKMRQ